MRLLKATVLIFLAVFILNCGSAVKSAAPTNSYPTALGEQAWEHSRNLAVKAEDAKDPKEKSRLAQDGISAADECIMKNPEQAECYYWRAINTGVYYSAHVVGYQDGLKSMIRDCKKVLTLNDKLEHGGAYRTLGKIYTDVPETTITKDGVTQDLALSIAYLKKAVQIDSSYPENHIYLAEALMAAGKKAEAISSLANAEALVPQWKNHHDYSYWQKLNRNLSEKIK
jgi:tetratricopeptide (TPR) repeat protein